MHPSYYRYLSGLGDAEAPLGVDEEGSGGGAAAPAPAPASGPGWDTVLATTISALPVIAGKAADAYRTYEEAHGNIPNAAPGGGSAAGGAPHGEPPRPWYESPGFLIVAGLGLGVIVVVATRRK